MLGTQHSSRQPTLGTRWLQHSPASPPFLVPAPQTHISISVLFAFQITFEISKPEEWQIPIWIILGSTLGGLLLLALLVLVLWKVSSALRGEEGRRARGTRGSVPTAPTSHVAAEGKKNATSHQGCLYWASQQRLSPFFPPHPLCSRSRLQPPDDIPLKERRSPAASPSDAGVFLFSLIPTARLFSERQPPAGGGGAAAERSGAGVMLAGGWGASRCLLGAAPTAPLGAGRAGGASGRGCSPWGGL